MGKELLLWVETRALNYTNDMITTAAGQHNLGFRDYDWCTPPLYYVIKTIKALMFYKKHWISRVCHTAKSLWIQYNGKQSYPERLPNVTNVPKTHAGPTIWFPSIKLKLFKIQLTGSSLALFWFCKTVISEKSKNKSVNLLIKINLKSFNLIEWNQIVGPMCFLGLS